MMTKMMPKEFGAISGLFHAGVFTLQAKATEAYGKSIFREFVFPAIEAALEKVGDIGLKPVVQENIEDFILRFIEVLKKSMLVSNAFLRKKSENEYVFTLIECFMAGAAHRMNKGNGICPMALVMSAMIEKYLGKTVEPEYSQLTPVGSITRIIIK